MAVEEREAQAGISLPMADALEDATAANLASLSAENLQESSPKNSASAVVSVATFETTGTTEVSFSQRPSCPTSQEKEGNSRYSDTSMISSSYGSHDVSQTGDMVSSISSLSIQGISDFDDEEDVFDEGDRLDNRKRNRSGQGTPVVRAPLPRDPYADRYCMNYPRRGLAIIIDIQKFDVTGIHMEDREGSSKDVKLLKRTLYQLGFNVEVHEDLYACEMIAKLKEAAERDHKDADCFFCAIMTHGEENGFLYGTDGKVDQKDLTKNFTADKCSTLAGKPKIFVFQACRGDRLDNGVDLVQADNGGTVACRIPTEQDFLFVYPSPPGYYSWRTSEGSWYIQTLCRLINLHMKNANMDFLKILTRTNRRVGMDETDKPKVPALDRKKQAPYFESGLAKDLYLLPKVNVIPDEPAA